MANVIEDKVYTYDNPCWTEHLINQRQHIEHLGSRIIFKCGKEVGRYECLVSIAVSRPRVCPNCAGKI